MPKPIRKPYSCSRDDYLRRTPLASSDELAAYFQGVNHDPYPYRVDPEARTGQPLHGRLQVADTEVAIADTEGAGLG